ncbi:Lin1244/Lin1753 domain-containing protein [Bacteroides ihuae]|uniref:Lin1244/Lin1753 domain-containing protein n=1 Tax=Bacteroides ihuae TaxID=1852362 RepID=UPI00135669BA|nr:Lin1244/Lin1753 domain-containing protein [Bacteroides ihuae]
MFVNKITSIGDKGLEGYGVYWCLLEYLRMQKNYSIPLSLLPALAREFGLSTEYLSDIIQKYGLFVLDDEQYFSSPGLSKRMKPLDEKRKTMAAKKAQTPEVVIPNRVSKRVAGQKKTVSMTEPQQEYAPKMETRTVGTVTSEVVNSPAKEPEITYPEVMQKSANELFESTQNNAQNSMQNDVQNSAKTTQNALLQNADNEEVAACSLEEESKVEKDKEKYGCCGTTTARVITSTTTNNCQVSILSFLACRKKERSKVPTSKLLVSAYFHDDCSYERFNLLRSSSISCLMLRPPPSPDLRHKSFVLAG